MHQTINVLTEFLSHLITCEPFLYFLVAFAVFALSCIIIYYFMS